jgi:uncharacterized membrane protein
MYHSTPTAILNSNCIFEFEKQRFVNRPHDCEFARKFSTRRRKHMKQRVLASLILITLDVMWILLFMRKKYATQIQNIQASRMKPNFIAGLLAYALMIIGLCAFVLPKIAKDSVLKSSIFHGGLFGLVVYGIFDFTNMSILQKWDIPLALIDITWGAFVYSMSSFLGTLFS